MRHLCSLLNISVRLKFWLFKSWDKFSPQSVESRQKWRRRQQNFTMIARGRGFLYAHDDPLYFRMKVEGSTKYLKCTAADQTSWKSSYVRGIYYCIITTVAPTRLYNFWRLSAIARVHTANLCAANSTDRSDDSADNGLSAAAPPCGFWGLE